MLQLIALATTYKTNNWGRNHFEYEIVINALLFTYIVKQL